MANRTAKGVVRVTFRIDQGLYDDLEKVRRIRNYHREQSGDSKISLNRFMEGLLKVMMVEEVAEGLYGEYDKLFGEMDKRERREREEALRREREQRYSGEVKDMD